MYDIPTEPPTGGKPLSSSRERKPLFELTESEAVTINLLNISGNDKTLIGCATVLINYITGNYLASSARSDAIKHILFAVEKCAIAGKPDNNT